MATLRPAAVAGFFYPDDPIRLQSAISRYLGAATPCAYPAQALIVPHAGYVYSAPTAACGYISLQQHPRPISQVVLLGPAHYVPFVGIAASHADYFVTPLGKIAVNQAAIAELQQHHGVHYRDLAHQQEHSLEVQLPFLQMLLTDFKLIPLVVGEAHPQQVFNILKHFYPQPETLIIVSSDLSHYHPYAVAKALDLTTCQAIEALQPEKISREQACGRIPIQGLLQLAQHQQLTVHTLDYRNSGDTAGSPERVVGYGAYLLH